MASCGATFTVAAAEDLTVDCPRPHAATCSSAADILVAYNAWVAGFSFDGGCDVTDNSASIPALGDLTCGGTAQLRLHRHLRSTAARTWLPAAPLSPWARRRLTVDCPADPLLPMLQRRRHTGSTTPGWYGFSFDGGCDVTDNSASIPPGRFDLRLSSASPTPPLPGTTAARTWLPATPPSPWQR
ncbi:MAG: hypothetical protein H6559_37370 [Lewinellaceae bacterium]|nr:hypothetical protein [Lewinellaceae bacterium]